VAQFPAQYHDGVTAAGHPVTVTVASDGLEIAGAGLHAFWRRQDIELIDKAGKAWRLGSREASDARLVVEKSKAAEEALRAAGVIDPRRDALRSWGLVGGLLALSAALAFIVFFAIPMGAEPLARATPRDVETQLGENLARQINVFMKPCQNTAAADAAIAPMMATLEEAAEPGFPIVLQFVREKTPNALALAGGQVMVTSGLLEVVESPDELAAVIAHEIGHVKSRDAMVALYRNAGLGILLELITGGSGVAQQAIMLGGQLTELSYTRAQESRADRTALATLDRAGLDPAALGRAFERLKAFVEVEERPSRATDRLRDLRIPEWMKSHPDLDRRIIAARAMKKTPVAEAMTPEAWAIVRSACQSSGPQGSPN
jgi:beta-barrel assembly-enhancing protease